MIDDAPEHKLTIRTGIAGTLALAAFLWSIIEVIAVIVYLCQGELGQVLQEGLFAFLAAGVAIGAGMTADHFDTKANPEPVKVVDPFADMDAHIDLLGHDAVLQWLNPSVLADFPSAEEILAREKAALRAAADKRRYEANRKFRDDQKAAAERSQAAKDKLRAEAEDFARRARAKRDQMVLGGPIVAEITQFGQEKPVRVIRGRVERAPSFTAEDLQREINHVNAQLRQLEMQYAPRVGKYR